MIETQKEVSHMVNLKSDQHQFRVSNTTQQGRVELSQVERQHPRICQIYLCKCKYVQLSMRQLFTGKLVEKCDSRGRKEASVRYNRQVCVCVCLQVSNLIFYSLDGKRLRLGQWILSTPRNEEEDHSPHHKQDFTRISTTTL